MFNRNQEPKTLQAEGEGSALNKQNFFTKENPGVVNLKANQGDFEIGNADFQIPSNNSQIAETEMPASPANNPVPANGGARVSRQSQDEVNSELFAFSNEVGNNAGGNMQNGARNIPNNNMNARPTGNESPYKVNQAVANEESYSQGGGINDNDSEELLLNEETVKEKESMNWAIFVLFLVIIVLMGGVIYLFVENQKLKNSSGSQVVDEVGESQTEADSSTETEAIKEEKTETVASADKSETGVKILNASGVAGAAGKIKDFLGSDYKKVETGNYSKTTTGTIIYYSEEKFKVVAEELAESLKEKKLSPEVELASSSEDKSADIVVVLGK